MATVEKVDLTSEETKSSKKVAVTAKKATSSKKKTTAKKKAVAKKAASSKTAASEALGDGTQASKKKTTTKSASSSATNENSSSAKSGASKKVTKKVVKDTEADMAIADPQDVELDDDSDTTEITNASAKAPVPYERNAGHYMDTAQLAHFSEKLAEWKQQLMEEVDRTVGHMKDDATNFPDPNDRATQEEEFSLELRTRDRERKLIKKINEAQKRIDDDEYGYCETCGIEIGVNRLEARPTAELCIDCKTLEEIRERQTA